MRAEDLAAEDLAAEALAHPRSFWLDGGGARAWSGSRSMVGRLEDDDVSLTYAAAKREVTRHQSGRSEVVGDDVFAVLAAEVARTPDDGHWVGYLGHACRPDLPARPAHDVPDAVWMRPSRVRFVDHGPVAPPAPPRPPALRDEPVPPWYADAFARVQEQLRAGNSYEVNLTHRETSTSTRHPLAAYSRLRAANPAPYAGCLRHASADGEVWLLSSSPERYAVIDRERWIETRPIKGTTPRAADAVPDEEQRVRLAADAKYRAENLMIVDLLRNDLSLVCEVGTVSVPTLMEVESYASVHQLVSTVRGRLREDVSTLDAVRALFPAGSMTGAPKLRTMEIIDAVEGTPRGVYSGAFGWVGGDGRADLGVVIRSLVATPAVDGWSYTLGTGGGITVRSDVTEEYAETRWKAARLRAALTD